MVDWAILWNNVVYKTYAPVSQPCFVIVCTFNYQCQQIEIGSGSDDQEAGSSIDIPTAISGSGDLPDTQGGDDEDILIVPGSGAGETTTRKATTVAVSTNPDDEGGDDDNEIIIMEGSGPGQYIQYGCFKGRITLYSLYVVLNSCLLLGPLIIPLGLKGITWEV